jgi:large repetitive protein
MRRKLSIAGLLFSSAVVLNGCGGSAVSSPMKGTASGLRAGNVVVIQNNKGDSKALSKNEPFVFDSSVEVGKDYAITVKEQPVGASCVVVNGTGIIGQELANIDVRCEPTSSVIGLTMGPIQGKDVTLALNGVPMRLPETGNIAFPGLLPPGSVYSVTNLTPPSSNLVCSISNASGIVRAEAYAFIFVSCYDPDGPKGGTL